MSVLSVFPQTLYVRIDQGRGAVIDESMKRVAELYGAQKTIAPTHVAVDSKELFEFLEGVEGDSRRNWAAQTLRNMLGENFSPRWFGFWSGPIYDEERNFFAFAVSIPPADSSLIPENAELPAKGTPVHLTVFELRRNES